MRREGGLEAPIPVAGREPPALRWLATRQIDSLAAWHANIAVSDQPLYDAFWNVQKAALREIVSALQAAGVEPLVFKGAEFFYRFWGDRALNVLKDVDLLVRPSAVPATRATLRGLGFAQGVFDRNQGRVRQFEPAEVARRERNHYELVPFIRLVELPVRPTDARRTAVAMPFVVEGESVLAAINVDVHHSVATNIDGLRFFGRSQPSRLGVGATLSDADHLWFTVSRFYTEVGLSGKSTLRELVYATRLLRGGAIDWDVVLRENSEHSLAASLYYYLRFLDTLLGDVVPPAVLTAVEPLKFARSRDWGWQLGRLFDFIEPFPCDVSIRLLSGGTDAIAEDALG